MQLIFSKDKRKKENLFDRKERSFFIVSFYDWCFILENVLLHNLSHSIRNMCCQIKEPK